MEQSINKEEVFIGALAGKKIPVLTLDNKWYRMFATAIQNAQVADLEKNLNDLIKRQGKITTESKDLRKIKKRLMDEIVPLVNDLEQGAAKDVRRLVEKIEENKRLIEECNDKLHDYQLELEDFPERIDKVNRSLMIATMNYAYGQMRINTDQITQINEWVSRVRDELKENLIQKQQLEIINHNIYSFMHNLFGADVMDLFDLKYDPEQQYPKKKESIADTSQ
ncbi:MAG: hypothetical protein LBM69_05950 [Lachnospiraceae bacterium]|jgi:hypothetical protein|nr:hypothetical protein [Lachnospiraceae bacterium]